jgi:uncharacterized protein YtpQ (UPF0354 family)
MCRVSFFTLVALFLASVSAAAQDIPRDADGFTSYVAERMRQELPNIAVSVKAPLTLSIGELQGNLDRIFQFCGANTQGCANEVTRYVQGAVQVAQAQNAPPTKEAVRLVVRSAAYVKNAKSGSPDIQPRALVDGLFVLPVLNSPRVLRMLTERDNRALGLSTDQVFELGLTNLNRESKPLMEIAKPAGRGQIGKLVGNPFHPSRLIEASAWAPLAQAQGGTLIVAAPTTDAVLYIGESTPVAIDALRALIRNVAVQAANPLSDVLLRWTPTGWEPVT